MLLEDTPTVTRMPPGPKAPPRRTAGSPVKIARTSSGCETRTIGASAHAVRSVNGSPWRRAQRRRKAVGRATHSAVWTAAGSRGPGGSTTGAPPGPRARERA